MIAKSITAGSIVSITIVLAAYLYKKASDDYLRENLESILSGLLRVEQKFPVPHDNPAHVAVGFGACQDVIANALQVLQLVNATAPKTVKHHHRISNQQELLQVFTYFFQHGAAAERYVSSNLLDVLTKAADTLKDTRYELGGNAAVMGRRFALEGCKVLLGAKVSPKLLKALHQNLIVSNSKLEKDDVHLILEYQSGDVFSPYKAPRANRFIVHSDDENPKVSSLDDFEDRLDSFDPQLVVIGGLQMMDNNSPDFHEGQREDKIKQIQKLMMRQSSSTRIHFEMASFTEETFFRDVTEKIIPCADSLGMNEQELPNLYSILRDGNITLISDPYPRVATVLDQMRQVWSELQTSNSGRLLTRLHVHTLAYQAIMIAKGSVWKNSMAAAAKASLTANRHVCGSSDIDPSKAHIIMDESFSTSREDGSTRVKLDAKRPVSCWEEGNVEICIAPVLVCTDVRQTAGGGDNISAAGLVLQL